MRKRTQAKKTSGTRSHVSVSLSRSLRRRLEEARERSGFTLTAEIETRLRDSLNHLGGDELLLLRIDSGLLAWLQAFVDGPGFFGDLNHTAVYLIRTQLLEMLNSDFYLGATIPKLPSPQREANMESPKYQALLKAAQRDGKPRR